MSIDEIKTDLSRGFHVAELVQNVTAQLPPDFKDWPANIQDKLFLAAAELSLRTGKQYELYHAECGFDIEHGSYVRALCIAPIKAGDTPITGDH